LSIIPLALEGVSYYEFSNFSSSLSYCKFFGTYFLDALDFLDFLEIYEATTDMVSSESLSILSQSILGGAVVI